MDIGIQIELDAQKALADSESLWENLELAKETAAQIKIPSSSAQGIQQAANASQNLSAATDDAAKKLAQEQAAADKAARSAIALAKAQSQLALASGDVSKATAILNAQLKNVDAGSLAGVRLQTQVTNLTNLSKGGGVGAGSAMYGVRSAIDAARMVGAGGGERAGFYAVDEGIRAVLASGAKLGTVLPIVGALGAAATVAGVAWYAYSQSIEEAKNKSLELAEALQKLPQILNDIADAQKAGVISSTTAGKYQSYLDKSTPLYIPNQTGNLFGGKSFMGQFSDVKAHKDLLASIEAGNIQVTDSPFTTVRNSRQTYASPNTQLKEQDLIQAGIDQLGKKSGVLGADNKQNPTIEAIKEIQDLTKSANEDALTGFAKQKQVADETYQDQIAKLKIIENAIRSGVANKTAPASALGFFAPAQSALDSQHNSALSKIDLDERNLSNKNAEETSKQELENYSKMSDIQKTLKLDLISDDQEKKVAEVNQHFDDIRDKITDLQMKQGVVIPDGIFSDVENARRTALGDIKPKKNPIPYGGQSLTSLETQRVSLSGDLGTAQTVEEYQKMTAQIESIDQAMKIQLEADNTNYFDDFKYGIMSVEDQWANTAQSMVAIGSTLATSLDNSLSNALTEVAMGTKKPEAAFEQMAISIATDLEKVTQQTLLIQPLLKMFTGLASGKGLDSSVSGAGGIVSALGGLFGATGDDPMAADNPDPVNHFGGVVRYAHGGDAFGDETRIVARKGEGIFTPEQMKAMGAIMGGGGKSNVTILNLSDPNQAARELALNPDAILNPMAKRKKQVNAILG